MIKHVKVKTARHLSHYSIFIGDGLLSTAGEWASNVLSGKRRRIAVISNPTVFRLYGERFVSSLRAADFSVFVHLIGDGERFKNLRTLERTLEFLSSSGMGRTDSVAALGGGVVGDLAGFAAAIYLRGIPFLQVPTTLLAMIDSSVGGKTGVNSRFGKNLIGAFHQPSGVLIDPQTLATLPRRELTAGFCEAIKQGAIGSRKLFDQTAAFLARFNARSSNLTLADNGLSSTLSSLLAEQVRFKAGIVAGDELEQADRLDPRSRKILNFGHTFGHALEKVTKFKYLRHGEAVGHGILFAAALSKNLGLLPRDEVTLLYDVVRRAGKLPPIGNIDPKEIFSTFKFDKKNVDGSLHWILLESIGRPRIVPHSSVGRSAQISAFKEITRI